jgi:uncharacterized NAD-dependent epimerase/dehydratase family protein
VLADDPDREAREHFESQPVPPVQEEAALVESLSEATVAAVSTWGDPDEMTSDLECPVHNVYHDGGSEALLDVLGDALGLEDRP